MVWSICWSCKKNQPFSVLILGKLTNASGYYGEGVDYKVLGILIWLHCKRHFPCSQTRPFWLSEIFWNDTVTFVEYCSFSECDNPTHRDSALIMGNDCLCIVTSGAAVRKRIQTWKTWAFEMVIINEQLKFSESQFMYSPYNWINTFPTDFPTLMWYLNDII